MLTWQNVFKYHAKEYCGCGLKAARILISGLSGYVLWQLQPRE
jgi:hypothetical protein